MSKRVQLILGSLVLFFGLLALISNLLDINLWSFCFPIGLILVGVWILLRPKLSAEGGEVSFRLFGGLRQSGIWAVEAQEIWMFVGDVHLDLTQAEAPPGETVIRIIGFVGDINLTCGRETGVLVSSTGFLTSAKSPSGKTDKFVDTYQYQSEGYEQAERKVRLETLFFVNDLKVSQV